MSHAPGSTARTPNSRIARLSPSCETIPLEEAQGPLIRALRTFSARDGAASQSSSNGSGNSNPPGGPPEVYHNSGTGVHNAPGELR